MNIFQIYNIIQESKIGRFSGAGIIFLKEEEVLVLKKHKNTWGFPGGKPVEGETPIQTAKRESKEEVGKVPGKQIESSVINSENNKIYYSFVFKVDNKFEPILSDEHIDYSWINYKNLEKLNLSKFFLNNLKIIKNLIKKCIDINTKDG